MKDKIQEKLEQEGFELTEEQKHQAKAPPTGVPENPTQLRTGIGSGMGSFVLNSILFFCVIFLVLWFIVVPLLPDAGPASAAGSLLFVMGLTLVLTVVAILIWPGLK